MNRLSLFLCVTALAGLSIMRVAGAQDMAPADNETVQTLGTIIESQLADEGDPAAGIDGFAIDPETNGESDGAVIDPDFLSGEGRSFEDYGQVTVRILDKVTAETRTHDLDIDKTVIFGSLRIRPKACRKTTPIEEPESAAFLQVWEKIPNAADAWVFSGWMFASSPSLSAMDHPVYDVWVLDCQKPLPE